MKTNDQCSGPCFWGIIPGVTNFDEALEFIKSLIGVTSINGPNRTYVAPSIYKNNSLRGDLTISSSDAVVQHIGVSLGNLDAPYVSSDDWLAFRPDSILRAYGPPKQVLIGMGESREGQFYHYEMILLYGRMYIHYSGTQITLHACPIADHKIKGFTLEVFDYYHIQSEQNWKGWVDLTQMSSITIDRFYKILTGDPDLACFDLDFQKYLDQYKK